MNSPATYLPRVTPVTAIQFTGENFFSVYFFATGIDHTDNNILHSTDSPLLEVGFLHLSSGQSRQCYEDKMEVKAGDWLVKDGAVLRLYDDAFFRRAFHEPAAGKTVGESFLTPEECKELAQEIANWIVEVEDDLTDQYLGNSARRDSVKQLERLRRIHGKLCIEAFGPSPPASVVAGTAPTVEATGDTDAGENRCPSCGSTMQEMPGLLLSMPPQKQFVCPAPGCGVSQYRPA